MIRARRRDRIVRPGPPTGAPDPGGVRQARVVATLAVTLVYRTATGMGPLAILLTVSGRESLGVASIALTAWTLLGAVSQPLWASLTARRHGGLVLVALGGTTALAHAGVGAVDGAVASIAVATLAGATLPPITAQARGAIAALVDDARRDRAFALESALASSAFVLAPLLVAVGAAASAGGPVLVSGLLLAASTLAFVRVAGTAGAPGQPAERAPRARSLRTWARRLRTPWTVLVGAGAAAYGMLAVLEIAAVARLGDDGTVALTLAGWSAASLVGGVAVARYGLGRRAWLPVLCTLPLACCALAVVDDRSPVVFAVVLVASGPAVAPTLGAISSQIARRAHGGDRLRAYAWLQTGSWVGSAAATSVAGLLAEAQLGIALLLAGCMGVGVIAGLRAGGAP